MSPTTAFQGLSAHDVAAIFRWVDTAAAAGDASASVALRSTCRLAVRGFDCAVHAGWIAIAGHQASEAAEEGATCVWVSGWFPLAMRRLVRTSRDRYDQWGDAGMRRVGGGEAVVARYEHRLISSTTTQLSTDSSSSVGRNTAFAPPRTAETLLCETLSPTEGASPPSIFSEAVPAKLLCAFYGVTTLRFHNLAAATVQATTSTPIDFLRHEVGANLRVFDSTGLTGVTVLRRGFLEDCRHLTKLDATGFTSVTSIESSFLSACRSLKHFDSTPMAASLRNVGEHWMEECTALTSVNAAGLANVTSVGDGFLYGAEKLVSIENAASLRALVHIGPNWCSGCTALRDLDATGFIALVRIDANFCEECVSLKTFDGSTMRALARVGSRFMFGCKSLTAVDASGWTAVGEIDSFFFNGCESLTDLHEPNFASLKSLGLHFASACRQLRSLDTSRWLAPELRFVRDAFGQQCRSLTSVDASGLANVTRIDSDFFAQCTAHKHFDASKLTLVASVGDCFLAECTALTSCDVSGFTSLKSIGSCFLDHCHSITAFDMRRLTALRSIGRFFMRRCTALTRFDDSGLGGVFHVGEMFLDGCAALERRPAIATATLTLGRP